MGFGESLVMMPVLRTSPRRLAAPFAILDRASTALACDHAILDAGSIYLTRIAVVTNAPPEVRLAFTLASDNLTLTNGAYWRTICILPQKLVQPPATTLDFDDFAAFLAWCFDGVVEPVSVPVADVSDEPDEPLDREVFDAVIAADEFVGERLAAGESILDFEECPFGCFGEWQLGLR